MPEQYMTNIGSIAVVSQPLSLLRPTAAAILVAGDVAVENNQFDCKVELQNQDRFNSVIAGFTTRVVGNLFSDSYLNTADSNPGISVITWGSLMNSTTSNQTTRCLLVEGSQRVNQGNLSLYCPVQETEQTESPAVRTGTVEGVLHWMGEGWLLQSDLAPVTEVQLNIAGVGTVSTTADDFGQFSFEGVRNDVPLRFRFAVPRALFGVTFSSEAHYLEHFGGVEDIDAEANQPGNVVAVWQRKEIQGQEGRFEGRLVFRASP